MYTRDSTVILCSLSVYLSVCLSICLSVCLSVYLSVCLSVCLSVYLSVCLCLSFSLCVVMVFARRERSAMALISVTSPAHNTTATCETPTQHNDMCMYIHVYSNRVSNGNNER